MAKPHDPRDDAELRAAEALDAYLTALDRGERPAPPALDDADARDLAATVAWLRQIDPAALAEPAAALPGDTPLSAPVAVAEPPRARSRRPSRRALLATGLTAAASLAAGVGAGALLTRDAGTPQTATGERWTVPLVGLAGTWITVARLSELAPGAVQPFATPQVTGNLLRRPDGSLLALSGACTHMGCLLSWNVAARTFDCPCHNGRFDSEGHFVTGLVRYLPLPRLQTQVVGDAVRVYVPAAPATDAPTAGNGDPYP